MNLLRYFLLKFSKFSKRFSFIIQIFFSISFRLLTIFASLVLRIFLFLCDYDRDEFSSTRFLSKFSSTRSLSSFKFLFLSPLFIAIETNFLRYFFPARNYWNIEIMLVRNRIRQTAPATSSGKPVRPFFPSHFTFLTLDNSFYQFQIRNFGSDWKELAFY